jgi:hypothetical protein
MAFPRNFDPALYRVTGEDRFTTWKDRYNDLVGTMDSLVDDLNELYTTMGSMNDRINYLESGGGSAPPVGDKDDGTWMDTVTFPIDLSAVDVSGTDDSKWTDLMVANPPAVDLSV